MVASSRPLVPARYSGTLANRTMQVRVKRPRNSEESCDVFWSSWMLTDSPKAAKLALVGFAETLAKEGAKYNIFTNVLAPGAASRLTQTVWPKEVSHHVMCGISRCKLTTPRGAR